MISYKFITNFAPLSHNNNNSKLYLKFMQKIILNSSRWSLIKQFCKNFIIFLCFLNYFYKQKSTGSVKNSQPKIKIFILPLISKNFILLKAPFVNKLAKKHYALIRYKIIVSFHYYFNKIISLNRHSQINTFIKILTELFSYFESNICYNHKITIKYQFLFKK